MSSNSHKDDVYHEKELILNTLKTSLGFAGVGLLVAAVQNSYYDSNTRAATVFTKYGSTITGFALLGGIFTAAEIATANIRKTDDWINGAVAGCATGLTVGIRARSHVLGAGACLGIGGLMSLYEFSGAWKGLLRYKTEEEKREWRKSFFKKDNIPTVNEE